MHYFCWLDALHPISSCCQGAVRHVQRIAKNDMHMHGVVLPRIARKPALLKQRCQALGCKWVQLRLPTSSWQHQLFERSDVSMCSVQD